MTEYQPLPDGFEPAAPIQLRLDQAVTFNAVLSPRWSDPSANPLEDLRRGIETIQRHYGPTLAVYPFNRPPTADGEFDTAAVCRTLGFNPAEVWLDESAIFGVGEPAIAHTLNLGDHPYPQCAVCDHDFHGMPCENCGCERPWENQ